MQSVQQRRAKLAEIEKRKRWSANKRKRKRNKKTNNAVIVNDDGTTKEEKEGSDHDSSDSIEDGTEFAENQRKRVHVESAEREILEEPKRHRRGTSSNISDAVIQSLVANSSQTLMRLQSRSKQKRYKMNLY